MHVRRAARCTWSVGGGRHEFVSRGGCGLWRVAYHDDGPMLHVQNNQEQSRYELLDADEAIGVMSYTVDGDTLRITHTEVDRAHRGRGHAEQLVQEALDDIRDTEMYVQPLCSYVRHFITSHPEYADLVKEA